MANPSLAEYIAQSQRGLYQSVFGPGFMKKAGAGVGTPFTVDTATGIFNTTYGRKVWQALNNQTRFFVRMLQADCPTGRIQSRV